VLTDPPALPIIPTDLLLSQLMTNPSGAERAFYQQMF
jgi:hypothetical protein